MVPRPVSRPLLLALLLQLVLFPGVAGESIEQLLYKGAAGLAEGVVVDRRKDRCGADQLVDLDDSRVVEFLSVELLLRVAQQLVAYLDLLRQLVYLDVFDLQLQIRLLLLPLELQVLN